MIDVQDFFDAVREAATSRAWSRGIELARGDAVDGVDHDEDSVTLRVQQPGKTVALNVTLFLLDEEWVCDCATREAVCQHVTAATIAVKQAHKAGKAMPQASSPGATVGYRLGVDDGRLTVARVAVTEDREIPIPKSVGSVLAGTSKGVPELTVDEVDLTLDRLIQMHRMRNWNPESLPALFKLLAQVKDVKIREEPVRVTTDLLGPRVEVGEKGKGYVLRFEAPPHLREVPAQGVGLVERDAGLVLQLLDFSDLAGTRWERLPADMTYAPHRAAELVGTVLPDLRQRAEVVVKTRRLPDRVGKLEPRIVLEVEQRGSSLSVLPTLVYGDPPCARVDDGQLIHLGGPVPKRDRRGEQRVAEELRERMDGVVGRRLERTGAGAVELAAQLRAYQGAIYGEAHRSLYPKALKPRIDVDGRKVDVAFGGDGSRGADARDVLSAWQRGAKTVMLRGGGWAPLPENWLSQHGQRLLDLISAQRADGEVEAHAEPVVADLCDALDHPVPPGFDRLRPLLQGFEGLPTASLPEDLTADLRPYQRRGVDWLGFLRDAGLGGLLADDMGLGKTLQALCAIDGRTLVVCPRSVVHNWVDELKRFRPELSHAVYHGASRKLDDGVDVTLTTYALLRNDIEDLGAVPWRTVILDEAQAIKNPDSQVTRAAYQLKADFRLTLSGTPVENRLDELWSQMHFVNPGLLGGRKAFDERFGIPIANGQPGVAAHLRARIRPFVLRRVKDEVLTELPPRTDAVMHCELDEEERAVYDAVLAATRSDVLARLGEKNDVLGALEALLRLRQAACDAALVPGQGHLAEREGRPRASSKVRRLTMALEEIAAEGRRALVFSQWTSLLDRVEPHLDRAGVGYCRLDGSTRDREGVVRSFQAHDGPTVMLLSLKAGGTGLNLTAADHVFLLDPWWNPAVEDQAADRAHRIGQDNPVMVYRLVARETVEERILALQAEKRRLADAALGEADQAAGLTRADLEGLLA